MNMNISIKQEIERIKQKIIETIETESIYLFGSYAYGSVHDDSDIDIFVVIPDNTINSIEAMQIISSKVYKEQIYPIDIIVSKSSDFHKRKHLPTIERTIARKGVLLYNVTPPKTALSGERD